MALLVQLCHAVGFHARARASPRLGPRPPLMCTRLVAAHQWLLPSYACRSRGWHLFVIVYYLKTGNISAHTHNITPTLTSHAILAIRSEQTM